MIYHDGLYDLNGLEETVARSVQELQLIRHTFDALVVQGMSGVVVGVPVALALGVPIAIVRKEEEPCHHHSLVQIINDRALFDKRVVFLDDFVSAGATRQRVLLALKERLHEHFVFVGTFLYRDYYFEPERAWQPGVGGNLSTRNIYADVDPARYVPKRPMYVQPLPTSLELAMRVS